MIIRLRVGFLIIIIDLGNGGIIYLNCLGKINVNLEL